MSGNKAVLDSNIIIDGSKGIIDIENIILAFDQIFISIITYIEVLGFNFKDSEEKILVENILHHIPVLTVSKEIAEITVNYRKKRKIKIPDAIILATAKYLNASLLTRNIKDFQNIDNEIQIISPQII